MIDNWADDETITPRSTETNALRERLGLTDRFVVCYSGNLGRAHEFDTLLAAADDLRLEEAIVFLMIGGGARMVPLQRAVEARALDNFLFLPYQPREDLEDSLAAADVHLVSLLPALEGFIMPSKLYGILAAGRPVIFIGDSDGDTARIIRNAECGITVPVGAGGDLAAVIRRLMREPDARIAMGARARTVLTSSYSRSIAVDRWLTVLDVKRERRSAGDQPRALSNR